MAAEKSLREIMNIIQLMEDSTNVSLPKYAQGTSINSALFVHEEVFEAEIMSDVIKLFLDMYMGWVVNAIGLNTFITEDVTVRDIVSVAATESYTNIEDMGTDLISTLTNISKFDRPAYGDKETSNDEGFGEIKFLQQKRDVPFPQGKLFSVPIISPTNKDLRFNLNMSINLSPRSMSDKAAEAFLTLNFEKDLYKRWLRMWAGEMNFWDFFTDADLRSLRKEALKSDSDGSFRALLDNNRNAVFDNWKKILRVTPNRQNIANTISIYDKELFEHITDMEGIKFSNYSDRQGYFERSYAMAIVVVDQRMNKVKYYFNGVMHPAEFTFKQLMSAAKNETLNALNAMAQMSNERPIVF